MSKQITRWANRDSYVMIASLGWGIDEWDNESSGYVTFDAQRCLNYIIGKLDEFEIQWGESLQVTIYPTYIYSSRSITFTFEI